MSPLGLTIVVMLGASTGFSLYLHRYIKKKDVLDLMLCTVPYRHLVFNIICRDHDD